MSTIRIQSLKYTLSLNHVLLYDTFFVIKVVLKTSHKCLICITRIHIPKVLFNFSYINRRFKLSWKWESKKTTFPVELTLEPSGMKTMMGSHQLSLFIIWRKWTKDTTHVGLQTKKKSLVPVCISLFRVSIQIYT